VCRYYPLVERVGVQGREAWSVVGQIEGAREREREREREGSGRIAVGPMVIYA
jgi:hypothetical protein